MYYRTTRMNHSKVGTYVRPGSYVVTQSWYGVLFKGSL